MHILAWEFNALASDLVLSPLHLPEVVHTLDDVSSRLPAGAYTTLRTYQRNKALRLLDHIQRLEQTSRLAGVDLPLKQETLREALRQAVWRFQQKYQEPSDPNSDVRVRLTINLESHPGQAYIAIEDLVLLAPEAYRQGVKIVTRRLDRSLPEAKLTRFIERSRSTRQSLPNGVNEAVMVNAAGYLSEGLTSNFFAVERGDVRTAGTGVLAGVTRALVFESLRRSDIPYKLEFIPLSGLPNLQEAFITSSSWSVLPVCQVDDIQLGKPGPLTLQIMQEYSALVLEQIEDL